MSFVDSLTMNVEDIKPRPPLPDGFYQLEIKAWEPATSKSKKDGTDVNYLKFTFGVLSATNGVDKEKLAEIDDLLSRTVTQIFSAGDAGERLKHNVLFKDLMEATGLGGNIKDALAQCVGKTFYGKLESQPGTQVGAFFTNLVAAQATV